MSKYKVGDRVRLLVDGGSTFVVGDTGEVTRTLRPAPGDYDILVRLHGTLERKLFFIDREVELVSPRGYVITADELDFLVRSDDLVNRSSLAAKIRAGADTTDLYEVRRACGGIVDVQASLEYVQSELSKAEGLLDPDGGFEG